MSNVDEAAFEQFICDWLVGSGGYDAVKIGNPKEPQQDFDVVRALDTFELFQFIDAAPSDLNGTSWSRSTAATSPRPRRASPTGWPKSKTNGARWTCCATAWST
jgi:hypothetical protein